MLLFLYVLRHPTTGLVHWVGLSQDPVARVKNHIWASPTSVTEWIEQLRSQNLLPQLCVLDSTESVEQANEMEADLISTLREAGHPLLNVRDGGGYHDPSWGLEVVPRNSETPRIN